MHTTRTAVFRRAFGKPVLAGALVVLLFVAALGSASPCLHEWMHTDRQAPSHYCLVTVLGHGQTDVASVWVAVAPVSLPLVAASEPIKSFFVSHDVTLFPERGPPCLS